MTASIQFDSTEILNTTYVPRFMKHETVADRMVTSAQRAREDGEIFVLERYGKKVIHLQGTLIGTSQDDLDSKIDTFTELFSRQQKNLDISWNASTRRYVASCTKHSFDRDHYNTSAVPWTAEFTVLSGEGKDTSTTTPISAASLTLTTPATTSFTMSGSKPARPTLTVNIVSGGGGGAFPSGCLGIEYLNTDTGEKMQVTSTTVAWGTAPVGVTINCDAKTVTETAGGTTLPFYGVFPTFKIGTNNVQVSAGQLVNQSSTEASVLTGGTTGVIYAVQIVAQSFIVPYSDATFQGITLGISKTGAPGDLTIEIQTDTNGAPSGSTITNGSATLAAASVSTTPGYVTKAFTSPFTLSANTKYWIRLTAASGDASNKYDIAYDNNIYANGLNYKSTDGGSTWAKPYPTASYSIAFRVLYGGLAGSSTVKHTVAYTKTYL